MIICRVIFCCFLLLSIGLTGCALSEKLDVEINAKPTLLFELPLDDERIRIIHTLIYDSQDMFFDSVVFKNEVSRSTPVNDTLLTGVPEGDYSVICYGNLDQAKLPKLEVGVSMMDDLVASLDSEIEYLDSDKIYHSMGRFIVKRGDPEVMPVHLLPRYYNVELLLQSEQDNTVHINDYSVRLELVPAGVLGGDGDACADKVCSFVPNLVTDDVNYRRTSEFTLNRFDDDHGVMLVLFKMGSENARIPILPSLYEIDPNDTDDVTLPISITLAVDKLTVTILDWSMVIEQNENVGG